MIQRYFHSEIQRYMKTDDFVLELRQPKTEPLCGGVELVDYITGVWWVWCLCAHLLFMCVYGTGSSVFVCVCVSSRGTSPYHLPNGLSRLVIG